MIDRLTPIATMILAEGQPIDADPVYELYLQNLQASRTVVDPRTRAQYLRDR